MGWNLSATKRGPGRKHANGTTKIGRKKVASYGLGIQAQFDRQRAASSKAKHPLRDEHGAFTLTGARHGGIGGPLRYMRDDHPLLGAMSAHVGRRKWLAGISAMRGF